MCKVFFDQRLCLLLGGMAAAAALAGCASAPPAPAAAPLTAATTTVPVLRSPEPLPAVTSAEEGFTIGLEAFRCGELLAAERYTRAVIEGFPGTAWSRRSLFLHGRTLAAAGRTAEAADALLKVPVAYPEMADYALWELAEHYAARGRFTEAVSLYQRMLADHPAGVLAPRAALRQARALHAAGSLSEAAAAYEQVLRQYPRSAEAPEAGLGLAASRADAGDLVAAVRAVLDASVRYPGQERDEETDRVLQSLKAKGAVIPPLTAGELAERGRVLFRLAQYDRAQDAFSRALDADPVHPQRSELLLRSGIALFHVGRRPEAASTLERLLKARLPDCRCAEALYWLGKSYSRLGLREEAVDAFGRLVRSFPDSEWADDALYLTGNVYRDAGNRAAAISSYRRLADDYPDSSLADSGLWWEGWTYYSAGELRKAKRVFQELSRNYPRSFLANQATYWEGRAAERLNERHQAQALFRRVLTRGPYTYYGHRAAERLAGPAGPERAAEESPGEPGEDAGLTDEGQGEEDAPPDWSGEAIEALSADPVYRRALELMYGGMKREASAELSQLQEMMPRRSAGLIGLSKTFFELGDYHSSLMIVLRNFERLLERPSERLAEDLWLLAYPQAFWMSVTASSRRYGMDPDFVAAIMREESQFRPEALSPAGARGVMQVMPATGEWAARSAGITGFDRSRLFEPDVNIGLGTWYLSHLAKKFRGDPVLVSAAYNAGPEPVQSWAAANGSAEDRASFVETIPYQETRGYVKKVMRNYAEYLRIYGRPGTSLMPAANGAGATNGVLLCRAPEGCR
jgi:soluble lytic murein transglycosylase